MHNSWDVFTPLSYKKTYDNVKIISPVLWTKYKYQQDLGARHVIKYLNPYGDYCDNCTIFAKQGKLVITR